jgi:hypothetical protein
VLVVAAALVNGAIVQGRCMSGSIAICEADDGALRAAALFRRRYGVEPPSFPHHVLAFDRGPGGSDEPVCYIHFTEMDGLLLGGGACVDDRALRRMDAPTRAAIRAAGGLYRMTLDWAVRHFAPSWPAIFGYCGDPLAERIDLAAGFERTRHPHLLVHWTRPLPDADREHLVAQAHAIGPF